MPALSVAAFQLDGIFLGATLGRQMRNMMVVSVAAYLALCALLIPRSGAITAYGSPSPPSWRCAG